MASVERVRNSELASTLSYVLASPGQSPGATGPQVRSFQEYVELCCLDWEGFRIGSAQTPRACLVALLLPGRTAITLIPEPNANGIDPNAQRELTLHALRELAAHRLHYSQALLEPEAAGRRSLLESVGFSPLAPLIYLERDVTYPWSDPPRPNDAQWVAYSPATHPDFEATVEATYQDTLDCPELAGLRPVADVLASHKASGYFDPQLWQLARIGDDYAGCMLLSRLIHGPVIELVYLGVVTAWRHRGIGRLLLRRALAECRRVRARRLTTVVDQRNAPARRMYEDFGFSIVGQRDAYLWR